MTIEIYPQEIRIRRLQGNMPMAPILPLRATISALAAAQAHVERHLGRALTEDEAERFREHIRDSYMKAGA